MNSSRYVKSILKTEEDIFLIRKKSEPGFWNNIIFGLLSLILNRDKDYFLITNERIVLLVKNKLIINSNYEEFSKIQFNSNNDTISFKNYNSNERQRSLKSLRLSYEEIQKIKKVLN
ncbi:hypothetical protein [uncultured Algibacter sp.]|uniref:hypothetical protein n=1 Tax=uncultured Algibacter sp. TaxID=298659 RepID=UPI00262FB1F4|nr:hypothetical protein [uncultured Algibacter sp.]